MDKYNLEIENIDYEVEIKDEELSLNLNNEDIIKIEEYIHQEEEIYYCIGLDRSYKYIFKITPIDLMSLAPEEMQRLIFDYEDSLKAYADKIKLITLNNRYNFSVQINNLKEKMKKHTRPEILTEYEREINKLAHYEKEQQIQFHMVIYGDDLDELVRNITLFKSSFGQKYFSFKEPSKEELIKIVKKLNNL